MTLFIINRSAFVYINLIGTFRHRRGCVSLFMPQFNVQRTLQTKTYANVFVSNFKIQKIGYELERFDLFF